MPAFAHPGVQLHDDSMGALKFGQPAVGKDTFDAKPSHPREAMRDKLAHVLFPCLIAYPGFAVDLFPGAPMLTVAEFARPLVRHRTHD